MVKRRRYGPTGTGTVRFRISIGISGVAYRSVWTGARDGAGWSGKSETGWGGRQNGMGWIGVEQNRTERDGTERDGTGRRPSGTEHNGRPSEQDRTGRDDERDERQTRVNKGHTDRMKARELLTDQHVNSGTQLKHGQGGSADSERRVRYDTRPLGPP